MEEGDGVETSPAALLQSRCGELYWKPYLIVIFEPHSYTLHKVLQRALVDEEGLSTILCDIEARINARPLTYLSEDPKNPELLTPYHFLTGKNFMDLPEVNPEDEEWVPRVTTTSELRKVWSYPQRLIALWWKRWKAEYIVALNKFQKWPYSNEAPQVGDIVLIDECNVPKNKWKLEKITELYPGKDGIARTAKLRTSIGFIKRPTAKLHLIEPAVPNR
ncbi:hypothetical protein T4C_3232 [Trichinella pseudospiralis]|uniref:DUF5641 domain-containing protein n=1 Tax=Trichinella pseudospiralis TaxID=6337 RepID=A0A0V1JVE0_TRIPS|nr:hypothetical protein T4C_3232 [Trichinella pseudospiralis]